MNRIGIIVLKNLHGIPVTAVKLFRYGAHPELYTKEQKYRLIQYITKHLLKTGNIELKVFGREHIPKNEGYIFYPNHQGLFDGFAMVAACESPFSPVIKRELTTVPIVKQTFECLESLPMNREDIRQSLKVMQEVTKRVMEKENCLIFSEGTRRREGNKLLDFKGGSFKAAVEAKCPIVPVALIDSFKPFDQKGTELVTVQVHILQPILYEQYQVMETTLIAAMMKQRIETVIARFCCI